MMNRGTRAVIYTRVSLDRTGEGASVARQADACRKLAEYRGWDVVEVASDNSVSAYKKAKRPGWNRVLELIAAGQVDYVVAWHFDRMTRSMVDLEHLITLTVDSGVGIATVAGDIDLTTDMGRMIARILAAVARAEVERKGERQRLANVQRAAAGSPTAGVRPFGYTGDQLQIVEPEAALIRRAAADVLTGKPLGGVARDWSASGVIGQYDQDSGRPTANRMTADTLQRSTIKRILTNPRYAGRRPYLGEGVAEAVWPAILDMATHLELVAKLTDTGRRTRSLGGRSPTTLLGGLARCGKCGGGLRGAKNAGGAARYKCERSCVSIPREETDSVVTDVVVGVLGRPDYAGAWARGEAPGVEELHLEARELRARQSTLANTFAAGALPADVFTETAATLAAELDRVEAELERAGGSSLLAEIAAEVDLDAGAREAWDALDHGRKRAVIEAITSGVTIHPVGPGRRVFDPSRIELGAIGRLSKYPTEEAAS